MQAQQAQLDRLLDRPLWHDTHYLTGSYFQTLDAMEERLLRAIPDALRADAHALELLKGRLLNLGPHLCDGFGRDIALCAAKLDALSPLKTLSRGYSITYAVDGHSVVDSVQHVNDGDHIQVQVQDGRLACTVDAIERKAHV